MEDIMAILLVIACAIGVVMAGRAQWRMWQRHKKWKAEQAEAEHKRQIEATRKWRESRYQKQQVVGNGMAIQSGGNVSVGLSSSSSRVHSPSYAPSPTQSMQSYNSSSSDTLSDLANLAIIANTVNHWNDHSPKSSSKSEDYSPVSSSSSSSSSSSWGFDDDDSRRSVSSSFSSSDSSSSWSSSSSDSGPSSDW